MHGVRIDLCRAEVLISSTAQLLYFSGARDPSPSPPDVSRLHGERISESDSTFGERGRGGVVPSITYLSTGPHPFFFISLKSTHLCIFKRDT